MTKWQFVKYVTRERFLLLQMTQNFENSRTTVPIYNSVYCSKSNRVLWSGILSANNSRGEECIVIYSQKLILTCQLWGRESLKSW